MNINKNDFFLNFLMLKKYRILRHVTILFLLFIVIINYRGDYKLQEYPYPYIYYLLTFAYVLLIVVFYINMYFLIPKFLYKKHYVSYLVSLIIIIFVYHLLARSFNRLINPSYVTVTTSKSFFEEFYSIAVVLMPFILSSTTLKLFQRWISDTEKINELENKALKSELKALKNQINPHFLFNMLNNLNVLIKKDQEKASQVTIKLSDFLRHHLYENNQSAVFLRSEIQFLKGFLELEKIRRDDFSFTIDVKGKIDPAQQVPPNVFTVFVENAIKHSLDSNEPSSVKIDFILTPDTLEFVCKNTKPDFIPEKKHKGLGLQNVKRRLELLYDTRFELEIQDLKDMFIINLKLPL